VSISQFSIMEWSTVINSRESWLLEKDIENPGARFLALQKLCGSQAGDTEVIEARAAVMNQGPVPQILEAQNPDGSWTPQSGSNQSTDMQVVFLAELGADPNDERVHRACLYVLEHKIAANGAFAYNVPPVPSKAVLCFNSMLLTSLARLGFSDDPRFITALEWQARAITVDLQPGERYYKSGTCGPEFACGVNSSQPCGWGAVKALRSFAAIPAEKRSSAVRKAVEVGAGFLLSHDLTRADFPYTGKISSSWFKFGFPLSYWADLLEVLEVLADLGYGNDPRVSGLIQLILSKQDEQGLWKLENSLNGKMWTRIETRGQPSKWVTLRAVLALRAAGVAGF